MYLVMSRNLFIMAFARISFFLKILWERKNPLKRECVYSLTLLSRCCWTINVLKYMFFLVSDVACIENTCFSS